MLRIGVASMRRRIWALFIDFILVSILQSLINNFFGTPHVLGDVTGPMVSGGVSSYASTITVDPIWMTVTWLAYFMILEGLFAATAGKALAGLRVATLESHRPGWRAVFLRNLLRPIDALPAPYVIGGILALSSPLRQRLGDRVAGTTVVDRTALIDPPLTDVDRRRGAAIVGGILAALLAACLLFAYFGRTGIAAEIALHQTTFGLSNGQEDTISSYRLGRLTRSGSTATYPVSFTFTRSGQSCAGTLTLSWQGFVPGWEMSDMQYTCH
jgi:uncharacterized RDD family membrane protein YckC